MAETLLQKISLWCLHVIIAAEVTALGYGILKSPIQLMPEQRTPAIVRAYNHNVENHLKRTAVAGLMGGLAAAIISAYYLSKDEEDEETD